MGGSSRRLGTVTTLPEGMGQIRHSRAALTTALMNLASIVERADEGILPAVYLFIGKSLNASLSQLGALTLCRALVQALSSPLSGILGDRCNRVHVVAAGCLLWGVMTAAIGLSHSLGQAMVACAVNGLGLALVIPCVSSLIADLHPPDTRGNAFGMMGLTASLGGMAGAFYATNIGAATPFGIEGWRFSFHLVAVVSLATAAAVYKYAMDPRQLHKHPTLQHKQLRHTSGSSSVSDSSGVQAESNSGMGIFDTDLEQPPGVVLGVSAARMDHRQILRDIKAVLRIRSFQIIVLQGIVGSVPWQAMVCFTLFFQLLGFSDLQAAALMATFSFGCALGGLLGGTLGDRMARKLPNSPNGRILTNQFSVLVALPLSFVVLKGLPVDANMGRYSYLYGSVLFAFGLCISWCGCNNSALFSELVPEEQRSAIYAFDRSFEGAVGAMGAPLVGLTAERMFGFRGSLSGSIIGSDPTNISALSSALLVCMVVPWILCLFFFTALHWTFKQDRRKSSKRADEEVVFERQLLIGAVSRKRG